MEDEQTQRHSNGHTSVLFTCVKRFTRPEKRKRTIRSLIEERPQIRSKPRTYVQLFNYAERDLHVLPTPALPIKTTLNRYL